MRLMNTKIVLPVFPLAYTLFLRPALVPEMGTIEEGRQRRISTYRFILPFVIDNFYRPYQTRASYITKTLVPEEFFLAKSLNIIFFLTCPSVSGDLTEGFVQPF